MLFALLGKWFWLFLKTDSMISWGLAKVKPHQQIFQRFSMRYHTCFWGGDKISCHTLSTSSLVQISQSTEISSFHTHLHPVPLGILFFLYSNGQAWPEHQLLHPGQKWQLKLRIINYKVQLQKQLPHIQGGERISQQPGPINTPAGGLGGRGTRTFWRLNFWEGDITQCKKGIFLSTGRWILSDY